MAVCAAVLLTEAVFLLGASQFWRSSHQAQAIERVREAWYHASDPASFMTPEQVTLRGERMVRDGLLLGGMIYDSVGDPLAVFGQRPNLSLSLSRLSGVSVQRSSSASAVDAHLSPQQTGLAHHLIVRLPSGPIDAATSGQVREFGLSVLIIAGFSALLVMLASFLLVIRPLRAINNALREAVLNPDQADRYQLPVRRQDELGQIAGAMNMLFNSVSVVYQDELASMQRAIEGFGFAILQYDHEGRMIAANPSAMTIFNVQDFMALRSMNRNCASPLGAKTSMPQPLPDLLGRSDKPMLVTIHMDEDYFTAMAYSVAIRRGDGAPSRHFVAVMPMDDMMRESRRAIIGAKKSDAQVRSLSLEVQEMRRLLESCLCLLEPAPKSNETAPLSIMPDRILNSWYSEAARDGLVAGKLEHGLLPHVQGDPQTVRNVMRQAMIMLYSQTLAERPFLKVEAETDGAGAVIFTLCDVSAERIGGGQNREKGVDPTLPRAALWQALARAGGHLVFTGEKDGRRQLVFTLPAGGAYAMPERSEANVLLKSA